MKIIDALYINGKFDVNKEAQSCIAVKDGKIFDIGSEAVKAKYEKCTDKIFDLSSGYVYPGFIDTHMHLMETISSWYYKVDLRNTFSKKEIADKIKCFIKNKNIAAGEWIIGFGWNQENFSDGTLPDKNFLDEISKEHPILLYRVCLHICVLNSKALNEAHVTKDTISPEGGQIDKDINNNVTGILRENAVGLVASVIPKVNSLEQMKEYILYGCREALKKGITTLHSDDFGFVENRKLLLEVFMNLAKENKIPVKYVLQLRAESVEDIAFYRNLGLKSWDRINNLIIGPIKIISDGSLGSRTAALNESYSDDNSTQGIMVLSDVLLKTLIKESFNNYFDVAVHCIGDRAMEKTIEAFKGCYKLYKSKKLRPSIIHCQIANKNIIEDMKKYEIIANVQPIFINTDWKVAESRIGKERMKYSYLLKTFLKEGVRCSFGSDAPVEDFNSLFALYSAVERKDLTGKPEEGLYTEEALSFKRALDVCTIDNAYASFDENNSGRIKIGNSADFCVLSHKIDEKSIQDIDLIKKIKVIKTIVNGRASYEL